MTYKNILVPIDGSLGARRAIGHVLELAQETGADLHVLFVIDQHRYGRTPALSSSELIFEITEQEAEEILATVAGRAEDAGLTVFTQCTRGDPCKVILDYAEIADIDLIVMGHHGMSPRDRPHVGGCIHKVSTQGSKEVVPV